MLPHQYVTAIRTCLPLCGRLGGQGQRCTCGACDWPAQEGGRKSWAVGGSTPPPPPRVYLLLFGSLGKWMWCRRTDLSPHAMKPIQKPSPPRPPIGQVCASCSPTPGWMDPAHHHLPPCPPARPSPSLCMGFRMLPCKNMHVHPERPQEQHFQKQVAVHVFSAYLGNGKPPIEPMIPMEYLKNPPSPLLFRSHQGLILIVVSSVRIPSNPNTAHGARPLFLGGMVPEGAVSILCSRFCLPFPARLFGPGRKGPTGPHGSFAVLSRFWAKIGPRQFPMISSDHSCSLRRLFLFTCPPPPGRPKWQPLYSPKG